MLCLKLVFGAKHWCHFKLIILNIFTFNQLYCINFPKKQLDSLRTQNCVRKSLFCPKTRSLIYVLTINSAKIISRWLIVNLILVYWGSVVKSVCYCTMLLPGFTYLRSGTVEMNCINIHVHQVNTLLIIFFLFQNSRLSFQQNTSQCAILGVTCRSLHTTPIANKAQAGRYKVTRDRSRPLTYEMANQPFMIAHRKSWNSWNTSKPSHALFCHHTNRVKPLQLSSL